MSTGSLIIAPRVRSITPALLSDLNKTAAVSLIFKGLVLVGIFNYATERLCFISHFNFIKCHVLSWPQQASTFLKFSSTDGQILITKVTYYSE